MLKSFISAMHSVRPGTKYEMAKDLLEGQVLTAIKAVRDPKHTDKTVYCSKS